MVCNCLFSPLPASRLSESLVRAGRSSCPSLAGLDHKPEGGLERKRFVTSPSQTVVRVASEGRRIEVVRAWSTLFCGRAGPPLSNKGLSTWCTFSVYVSPVHGRRPGQDARSPTTLEHPISPEDTLLIPAYPTHALCIRIAVYGVLCSTAAKQVV